MILHKTRPIATAIAVPPRKIPNVFPPIFPNVLKSFTSAAEHIKSPSTNGATTIVSRRVNIVPRNASFVAFSPKISPAAIPRTNPTIILVNNPNWFHFFIGFICMSPRFLYKSAYMVYRNIRKSIRLCLCQFSVADLNNLI